MSRVIIVLGLVTAALATGVAVRSQELTSLQPPADLTTPPPSVTASGLSWRVLREGTGGTRPAPTDYVQVHFSGWAADGDVVDTSRGGGAPLFPLNRTIVGFQECVQLMAVGEQRRCWLPASIAYAGQAGRPSGPLVFDVELLDAYGAPGDPPANVAGPPDEAERTESGLAYLMIRNGTGTARPGPTDVVTLHYTGWTTDGAMFDTSLATGAPADLPLTDVIAGWTEGLQLMVEGDRIRFWVPEDLAYEGQAGAPAGMLVFDIALLGIN